jgi:hypothetical protein
MKKICQNHAFLSYGSDKQHHEQPKNSTYTIVSTVKLFHANNSVTTPCAAIKLFFFCTKQERPPTDFFNYIKEDKRNKVQKQQTEKKKQVKLLSCDH